MATQRNCAGTILGLARGVRGDVMSVQKNATRVAELMHAVVPGLDKSHAGSPPVGMNTLNPITSSLHASNAELQAAEKLRSTSLLATATERVEKIGVLRSKKARSRPSTPLSPD